MSKVNISELIEQVLVLDMRAILDKGQVFKQPSFMVISKQLTKDMICADVDIVEFKLTIAGIDMLCRVHDIGNSKEIVLI